MTENRYTLYGAPISLYSARARSYLRKNAVPFCERTPASRDFLERIVPHLGRWIIPVLETPQGEIIQDSTDIIDFLENCGWSRSPIVPDDECMAVIAQLFELFGSHGLLRPAMHYRWNFDEANLALVRAGFSQLFPATGDEQAQEAAFAAASGRMRKAAALFGVNEQTAPLIEAGYRQLLGLLETHLASHPYLLGGKPTIADYGMIGALHAHLGRDPAPLQLMQRKAPHLFAWVERMNTCEELHDGLLESWQGRLISFDDLPASLSALMRFIAEDYLPEIVAHADHANRWLADCSQKDRSNECGASDSIAPAMGTAAFDWRSTRLETLVMPSSFYLLQRLTDRAASLRGKQAQALRELFERTGLGALLDLRTSRRLVRRNNREQWEEQP